MRSIRCLLTEISCTSGHSLHIIEPLTAGACTYPASEWGRPGGSGACRKIRNVSVKRVSDAEVPEVELCKLHRITTRFRLHLIIERCITGLMVCHNSVFYFVGVLIPDIYNFLLLLCVGELRVIKDSVYD